MKTSDRLREIAEETCYYVFAEQIREAADELDAKTQWIRDNGQTQYVCRECAWRNGEGHRDTCQRGKWLKE